MPEALTPQIEGVSEEALKERINLRRVKDSVDLFDQLVQAGVWSPTRFCGGALLKLWQKYFISWHGLLKQLDNFVIILLPFTTDSGLMKWFSRFIGPSLSTACLTCHFGDTENK